MAEAAIYCGSRIKSRTTLLFIESSSRIQALLAVIASATITARPVRHYERKGLAKIERDFGIIAR
jgi:hypothetical protein